MSTPLEKPGISSEAAAGKAEAGGLRATPGEQSAKAKISGDSERREFFGEALRKALGPLVRGLDSRLAGIMQQLERLNDQAGGGSAGQMGGALDQPHLGGLDGGEMDLPVKIPERILRPPGAGLPMRYKDPTIAGADGEDSNREENKDGGGCTRCGKCVEVCPAQAIKMDVHSIVGDGFPYIVASEMACVVCDSLACMNHCPDGALLPVPKTEIRMGTAKVDQGHCLRPAKTGTILKGAEPEEDHACRICVDICPLGESAILISPRTGRVRVQHAGLPVLNSHGATDGVWGGCIGCGLCEQACPAVYEGRKAIVVIPAGPKFYPIVA